MPGAIVKGERVLVSTGPYVFTCDVCGKYLRRRSPSPIPYCTGPHVMLDDHPPEPMELKQ